MLFGVVFRSGFLRDFLYPLIEGERVTSLFPTPWVAIPWENGPRAGGDNTFADGLASRSLLGQYWDKAASILKVVTYLFAVQEFWLSRLVADRQMAISYAIAAKPWPMSALQHPDMFDPFAAKHWTRIATV